ncbi:HNH endonuclease, partial [Ancrocorticia sp.]|uniref:HNH endonuclease n=1 Tax=Ancrocorticia sp. TaxID=2593684 RepID=UPI003F927CE5
IAHMDHTHPFASGGHTTLTNGSGLCARCNYTKEYNGWNHTAGTGTSTGSRSHAGSGDLGRPPAESRSSDRIITTPTGHHYHSTAPPITPNLNRRN